MSYGDIWVDTAAQGGHHRVHEGGMVAGATFFKGEPVFLDGNGFVSEATPVAGPPNTVATALGIAGIAANGPGDAVAPYGPLGLNINWETGAAYATNAKIKFIIPTATTFFLTKNWTVAGTAFNDVVPAITDIGEQVGLTRISGVWGLDNSAAALELYCQVTDILDNNFKSFRLGGTPTITLGANGLTQYYIQFCITNHQFNP